MEEHCKDFHWIKTRQDIEYFLEAANELHDGYLIGVQYAHRGHTCGNPHWIDDRKTELRLRILVTSIYNKEVELVFEGAWDWQVMDKPYGFTTTAVSICTNGDIIWADDQSTEEEIRKDGCFVIASTMKWRFVE